MNRIQILIIVFVLFGFAKISAQEAVSADKWRRFETDDKEFSVAMPPNAVIDAEERKLDQILNIVAFQNGVEMELKIFKGDGVKELLLNRALRERNMTLVTKAGDFSILKSAPGTSSKFQNAFWIAKKDTMYFLRVAAKTEREKEVSRFLYSVILQGKPLFVQKEKSNFPEETVSVSSLKTSPEVIEAFERKPQKNKINITYEAGVTEIDNEIEGLTRKVIILERPFPSLNPGIANGGSTSFTAKLKIKFLANGQIGDIVVLTITHKDFSKACVEAAQKIRFIPAQITGKNADFEEIIDYTVEIFSITSTPIVVR
jgi:hypothetical protein